MAGTTVKAKKSNRTNAKVRQPTNRTTNGTPVEASASGGGGIRIGNRQQQDIRFRTDYGPQMADALGMYAGTLPEGPEQERIQNLANLTLEWCGIETRFTTVKQLQALQMTAAAGGGTS